MNAKKKFIMTLSILSIVFVFLAIIPICVFLYLKSIDEKLTPNKRMLFKAIFYILILVFIVATITEIMKYTNILI